MHVPTADELAAIAAAYLAVSSGEERPAEPEASPWRLAGRLPNVEPELARAAARSGSRWKIAGRLDD
jgi:soluble lytic murein transglycosylase-like protein